ncbi:MAG: polysaccharide lyase family protein [Terriglobia bacterium]
MMGSIRRYVRLMACALAIALASAVAARAAITLDTTNAADWKISNGALTVDWNSQRGNIFSMHLAGTPDDLIDVTNTSRGQPKGLYMDNTGLGGGATTAGFYQFGDRYIDWWITTASNSKNPFTYSEHFILTANDPGLHVYFVADHGASDIAGGIGQVQYVYRPNLALFTHTYSVNSGLNNLGATDVPLPDAVLQGTSDPGRNVQDATVDLHGLPLPPGYRREFYTKYDYSSQEVLHKAQGVYGSTLAAWVVLPSKESLVGGPTKQDLIFTGNLIIMECQSNHLDNQFSFNVPAGTVLNRLYGPFYFHFNSFDSQHPTAASLYREALASARGLKAFYDGEIELVNNGYVPSWNRGRVQVDLDSARSDDDADPSGEDWANLDRDDSGSLRSWVVLSDSATNFQYSHLGGQYWASLNPGGVAQLDKVIPGVYRLSAYVLGKWGELRRDNVTVTAHQPTHLSVKFTPENFSPERPVWTLGVPDRSAHEFLHGEIINPVDLDPNYKDRTCDRSDDQFGDGFGNSDKNDRDGGGKPSCNAVQDDREYWGNWNYWADFAAHKGAVIYYATPVGSTPATHDLSQWNYVQWHNFNPGLYAGIYNPGDDTTGGYKYICPAYVGNCATAAVPDWQVHFTTTADQQAQGQYVVMSVGLAATESSLVVSLNGNTLIWHGYRLKNADAMVRSGLSGTYQWVVFQWNTSQLNPPGADNVITLSVGHQGVMYDALRMEIASQTAAHESTGWNDYEYVNSTAYEPANDSLPNQ